jgi:hypothetical protein
VYRLNPFELAPRLGVIALNVNQRSILIILSQQNVDRKKKWHSTPEQIKDNIITCTKSTCVC